MRKRRLKLFPRRCVLTTRARQIPPTPPIQTGEGGRTAPHFFQILILSSGYFLNLQHVKAEAVKFSSFLFPGLG